MKINQQRTAQTETDTRYPTSHDVAKTETVSHTSPVMSFTEWDPLEEAIVGTASGAAIPNESEHMIRCTMPDQWHDMFYRQAGKHFPAWVVDSAQEELDNFSDILTSLGILVRRPEAVDWASLGGHTSAMPRDCLLVIGTNIIEAPMVWRSRQSETHAYRDLLTEYADAGATWVSAPRTQPRLLEAEHGQWAINEAAPAFDAADFVRVGRDIVGQLSHVTNRAGVVWLRRFLGSEYDVTVLDVDDSHAMHIDATVLPLRPGIVLVNPTRVSESSLACSPFAGWKKIVVQHPRPHGKVPRYMTSGWINMNVFSIDEERVFVGSQDLELAHELENHDFQVIPLPFEHVHAIGGSFHCATLDIRRQGMRESYRI